MKWVLLREIRDNWGVINIKYNNINSYFMVCLKMFHLIWREPSA